MKRRSREINIFSIAALDIFASAMGVFMLLALIALPSLHKTNSTPQENPPAAKSEAEPARTFLMVVISWNTLADIDLYVTTPKRNVYSFQNKTYSDESAELSVDANTSNKDYGGTEIFSTKEAEPGDYDIYVCKYGPNYKDLTFVTGYIITSKGVQNFTIPGVQTPDTPYRAPSINISDEGKLTILKRNNGTDGGTKNDKCILL
ncbi:MAG: hypothetical protein LBE38_05570 [Deltaproteobacteria bacterium]|jgi:hypothetical protein|nr:hypothetical protein [Deltaproteobacteria bacterium]